MNRPVVLLLGPHRAAVSGVSFAPLPPARVSHHAQADAALIAAGRKE